MVADQILNIYIDYFTKVLEDDLKAVVKPQYVDQLPKAVKGSDKSVMSLMQARSQMNNLKDIMDVLGEFIFIHHVHMLNLNLPVCRTSTGERPRYQPIVRRRAAAVRNRLGMRTKS
jgi:hypothetical protein